MNELQSTVTTASRTVVNVATVIQANGTRSSAVSQSPISSRKVVLDLDPATVERLEFLAGLDSLTFEQMAVKLLSEQAEAEAGLTRGPTSRRYIYR